MRINVAQQLKGNVGDVRHYSIDATTREGFPIQGEVKLVRTDRSILAAGKFQTAVKSICSRCLEEFEHPLSFTGEGEYFPLEASKLPLTVAEDTEGFVMDEDNILDLSETVRQSILLNLPIKPVCQPDCAGLCPQCGHNLNYGPCHCSGEQSDSRWSPLQTLLLDKMPGGRKRG